ncbi:Hypp4098 [Branchiostoma lanceolatum]|uniref:Hypp4098 protein n=1 Tax=Branchiostoma lanceolatum TaxID=7740 RepID=A0A8K0A6L7_BRALA|nr:Hypp4098 [Branchiostoma lanceolatum]
MERFAGKWCLSSLEFEKMKALFMAKWGRSEADMDKEKEQWMKTYMKVAEDGTHWKYGNVPQGDRAFTFDKTDQTCKLFRTPSSFLQSTFEMTGDGAMTIHSRGTFKMIFKITGYQMKLTQSMDEFSYDTVYTKCTCPE